MPCSYTQTEPQVRKPEFLFPAFFVVIGAVLGALLTCAQADWQATTGEPKRAKDFVLRAIGMELDALSGGSTRPFMKCGDRPLERKRRYATVCCIAGPPVFTSQIGKLRDVDDPLAIEVIHFYSDLGTLQQLFESVNEQAAELNRAPHVLPIEAMRISIPLTSPAKSTLKVLEEPISSFGTRLRKLRPKLPKAENITTRTRHDEN